MTTWLRHYRRKSEKGLLRQPYYQFISPPSQQYMIMMHDHGVASMSFKKKRDVLSSKEYPTTFTSSNGLFAWYRHMVKNPPCWMTKKCNSLQNKAISTGQAWVFFVLDVPPRSLPSSRADFIPCDSFMQRAHNLSLSLDFCGRMGETRVAKKIPRSERAIKILQKAAGYSAATLTGVI